MIVDNAPNCICLLSPFFFISPLAAMFEEREREREKCDLSNKHGGKDELSQMKKCVVHCCAFFSLSFVRLLTKENDLDMRVERLSICTYVK